MIPISTCPRLSRLGSGRDGSADLASEQLDETRSPSQLFVPGFDPASLEEIEGPLEAELDSGSDGSVRPEEADAGRGEQHDRKQGNQP